MKTTAMTADTKPKRRADLDVLRVGVIYLLIFVHASKTYDPRPFAFYWSPDLIPAVSEFTGFVAIWRMPLLFLIAGWSVILSFRARGLGTFMRERVRRIALPLLFACAFVCPLLKFIQLRSGISVSINGRGITAELQEAHGDLQTQLLPIVEPYTESFTTFLPKFYVSLSYFTWAHMWFLAYLLLYTLIAAPLIMRLSRNPAAPINRPLLWLILPGIILVLSETILRPHWPNNQAILNDWANMVRYPIYFLVGMLWSRHEALGDKMRDLWPAALGATVIFYIAYKLFAGTLERGSVAGRLIYYGLPAAVGWCFVLFLVGAAARFARQGSTRLTALGNTVLPIYILHLPVIASLAYFIDKLPIPTVARLALIIVSAGAVLLTLVFKVIPPVPILRAGFGMPTTTAACWGAAAIVAVWVAFVLLVF